jgi:hypothetical protein
MHLQSGGTNLTGPVTAPGTGGWQTWTTVTATGIPLSAGTQSIRLVFDSGSFNINWVAFALVSSSSSGTGSGSGSGTSGSSGDGGGGGGGCGLIGLDAVALLGALAGLRRRSSRGTL